MNILSLFDGMSCGQIALNKAEIPYSKYYASEIDKYAIQITQKNYPETVQLGDVSKINIDSLPKIDLLIGGSPCQGFSAAGKKLNFEDPRSKLFWEYVRIKEELNPKWFLLENVMMKKEWIDIISSALKVQSIMINSSDFSAQNRKRLYWTNIQVRKWGKKEIYLKDILESVTSDRLKSYCIDAQYYKGITLQSYITKHRRTQIFETVRLGEIDKGGQGQRIYSVNGKSISLSTQSGGQGAKTGLYQIDLPDGQYYIRKLTPIECERLQTVPDNYTEGVSNTQRYKMLGNGWTVDVIAHILSGMK
ncbi:MAG TPA: DNA (cytosine-5-)-methyltransferase [Leptospiraceae bacterium]|nr:DNA (cytosine-5-)-methyltransferase [Leptospiraceae bacterium]